MLIMSLQPKVSIVIPTYNRAPLLGRAIGSVLAQSYTDFELIVVDDASTDNTVAVVKGLNDSRIRYLCHKTNLGGSAARNTGIMASRGEYVAFQDSDDEWLPDKLEKQVELLNACGEEVGVTYSAFQRLTGETAVTFPPAEITLREGDISRQVLQRSFISTQTLLIRKSCLESLCEGFDERLPRFQDWEMVIRLALVTHFRFIDEPLVVVYDTPGNLTSNKQVSISARQIILDKHFDSLKESPAILAGHYCDLGHLNSLYCSAAAGRSWFGRAIGLQPLSVKAWVGWSLSLLGMKAYRQCLVTMGRNVQD
jgi:glycosyltransferase involved in cell wall biosynthesis